MSGPAPHAVPPGGLRLAIDRVVVRGGGTVAPAALAAAVERALAGAFAIGGTAVVGDRRVIRASAPASALGDADGIAAAIRAALAGAGGDRS